MKHIAWIGTALALLSAAVIAQEPYRGLGAESVTPEIVAKFAAPPLDPRITRDIEMMLAVRSPGIGIAAHTFRAQRQGAARASWAEATADTRH